MTATTNHNGKKRQGRPTTYTREIDIEICSRIANNEALKVICKDDHMPSFTGVLNWLSKGERGDERYTDFVDRYARARAASAETVDYEIWDLERRMLLPRTIPNPAYNPAKAQEAKENKGEYDEPRTIPNPDYVDPMTARVAIESKKWRAAHLKPTVYGTRLEVAHSGSVKHQHEHRIEAPGWLRDKLPAPAEPAAVIEGEAIRRP